MAKVPIDLPSARTKAKRIFFHVQKEGISSNLYGQHEALTCTGK
jgi:hypothetical protein